ncbi:TPA: 30S ribosomal protein S4 [Candidatus Dependentiae bacterium]|nr:MAG: 30S ribosomal protein S4 [candidate division TM6 bacterium GW2011_GWE2_31_21]KKP53103.1 MAG: 30S ribosomal protein S4 [candidate division TM6 bacterium GW2011_GWF2_33_332]HBS47921.1 30S ribosomal protein S4 [Candidatus Dependentiae bacterium]HBZ73475.1 30S ribosomal protein S4 [Candidatus Dependentiae bacterium]
MGIKTSFYKKFRQLEICPKVGCRVLERRPTSPGEHGRKIGTKKLSEYGVQLREKQRLRLIYGLRERQFHKFFEMASKHKGVTGETLLSYLERRIDNVVYRLKMTTSRNQSRQLVVHGHVLVNGKRVKSPSCLVKVGDVISLTGSSLAKEAFVKNVIEKRMALAIKVPDWLELNKKDHKGTVLRDPVRDDIKDKIEEHLIVELYSK